MIFPLDDSSPSPSPSGITQAAVDNALNVASLVFATLVGAAIGFFVALVIAIIVRPIARRSRYFAAIVKRVRTSFYLTALSWGAWIGLQVMLVNTTLSDWSNGGLVGFASHVLLIVSVLTTTWMIYNCAWIFEDATQIRQARDGGVSRKFETQAQIIRRLLQVLIIIVGVCFALFTFDAARQAMTTVLASAGLISVIAGLAAQQTLGNVFAGIQLAFTDAIRVGDVVVAGGTNAPSGKVEEITLSYIVVRLADERRLIVPSTYFTSNTFENWTRRAAKQLGSVELKLDWAAPMTLIRNQVQKLLLATDLWDGRSWAVQVADSDATTITVRIVVSAKDSGTLWDLRCYLRENMIRWIAEQEPAVRPFSPSIFKASSTILLARPSPASQRNCRVSRLIRPVPLMRTPHTHLTLQFPLRPRPRQGRGKMLCTRYACWPHGKRQSERAGAQWRNVNANWRTREVSEAFPPAPPKNKRRSSRRPCFTLSSPSNWHRRSQRPTRASASFTLRRRKRRCFPPPRHLLAPKKRVPTPRKQ